jgi:hypothetical protein
MHEREQHFAEGASVLRKKPARMGDTATRLPWQHPPCANHTLGQAEKVIAAVASKVESCTRFARSTLLLADLFGNLAGTDRLQKLRQTRSNAAPGAIFGPTKRRT